MLTRSMTFSPRDLQNQVVPGHKYLAKWIEKCLGNRSVTILDIGCWTGPMEEILYNSNYKITGVDLDEPPLVIARKKFPKYTFKQSDVSKGLPFKTAKFDAVLFFMVIEHILAGSETEVLKNINRVMKQKGNLFLSTMLSNPLSNLLDPAYFITGHRHYSLDHLTQLLSLAGFEVIESKTNGGWFTSLHIWLLYFFKHILHLPEPRGIFMDWLMEKDYRGKGFCEIEIRAKKIRSVV